ncbi:MAG: DUF1684 domain-containing protein [Flavobacteriaceae bacterium]
MRLLILALGVSMALLACKQDKKYHDAPKEETAPVVRSNSIKAILDHREQLNNTFKNPETSPLPDRYRKDFETLDFFPPDTTYIVKAKLVRTSDALPFLMPTTTNEQEREVVYGIVYFQLNGKDHRLEIYQNEELKLKEGFEDYLFLPFTDQTNGEETYGGGRYIDLRVPQTDMMTIDFNRAYNPYCAYNKKYSCPIVPRVNHLDTKVLAGLKDFEKDMND